MHMIIARDLPVGWDVVHNIKHSKETIGDNVVAKVPSQLRCTTAAMAKKNYLVNA